jgi:hypothetical protein
LLLAELAECSALVGEQVVLGTAALNELGSERCLELSKAVV